MKWINTLTQIGLTAIAFVAVVTPIARAGTFTFTAGCKDNFSGLANCQYASENNGELAKPSAGLQISMDNSYNQGGVWGSRDYTADFDGREINQIFGHTFDLNAIGVSQAKIKEAKLEIRLKALGSSLTSNDSLGLFFANDAGDLDSRRWGQRIGSDSSIDGLLATRWGSGSIHTFVLDLANLPLASHQDPNVISSNLLTALNDKRFLDVQVADDTSIDYVALQIETVPEPGISLLGLMGLTALGACLRDRKARKN